MSGNLTTLVLDSIDMDFTPSSPKCALLEFEFQSGTSAGAGNGGVSRHRDATYASPADELFYRGKLLPLHLPPRLQLVQKLVQQQQQVNVSEIKAAPPSASASAAAGCAGAEAEDDGDGGAKAGAKKYSWSKRLKLMKPWTSREYIKSFLAKSSDTGQTLRHRKLVCKLSTLFIIPSPATSPEGVLDSLSPEQVLHCNTDEQCVELVKLLPSTQSALLSWVVELMA